MAASISYATPPPIPPPATRPQTVTSVKVFLTSLVRNQPSNQLVCALSQQILSSHASAANPSERLRPEPGACALTSAGAPSKYKVAPHLAQGAHATMLSSARAPRVWLDVLRAVSDSSQPRFSTKLPKHPPTRLTSLNESGVNWLPSHFYH